MPRKQQYGNTKEKEQDESYCTFQYVSESSIDTYNASLCDLERVNTFKV